MGKKIAILAIESSCDDTSAAVIIDGVVYSNIIANQRVHEDYGGVVPELASRSHLQNIVPVVHKALKDAHITASELSAVAFTRGPGLLGSLLVGVSFAKGLALAQSCKLIEVNHLHAHVLASFISTPETFIQQPSFPFLCLLVSGGHTQIIQANSFADMHIIGSTIDDAAGEAFDKSAKIFGLPYPGGPHIDACAAQGNSLAYSFNKPSIPAFDFSFSGLKTSVLYFVKKQLTLNQNFIDENRNDLCASLQKTIVDILIDKLTKAIDETSIREIVIGGGVAANSGLRKAIAQLAQTKNCKAYIPELKYTTDNAAMIAVAAYYKYLNGDFVEQDIAPKARYSLDEYFENTKTV